MQPISKNVMKRMRALEAAIRAEMQGKAKVGEKTSPEGSQEAQEPKKEEPKLYDQVFEALKAFGHPADAKYIAYLVNRKFGLSKNEAQTYAALEYRRKHKGDVSRKDGQWTVGGGH